MADPAGSLYGPRMSAEITTQRWTCSTSLIGFVLMPGMSYCWVLSRPPNPLEGALSEVEEALKAKLYHLALVAVLTFPGICAALEDPRGYSGRDEYKKWYRENLFSIFPAMSEHECYSLRCGFVHKAEMDIKTKDSRFNRVIFTIRGTSNISGHNNILNDSLQFDIVNFCEDIIKAVRKWYVINRENPNVIRNSPNVVQYYPDGLRPYTSGVPIIA